VEKINDIEVLFFYPVNFTKANINKLPLHERPITENEELIVFKNEKNDKVIFLEYENKKGWLKRINYEDVGIEREFYYKMIADSMKVIRNENILIGKTPFNMLEIVFSPKFESEIYYLVEIFGQTKSEYDFRIRYKALSSDLQENIKEINDIISRIYL